MSDVAFFHQALTPARAALTRNRMETGALALVLVAYLVALWLLPKDVFWSPDEGIRLIMARMLTPPAAANPMWDYPGYRLDPDYEFHPSVFNEHVLYPRIRTDGSRMFPWPIWFPLITGWIYRFLGNSGLYLLPIICGWMTCLVGGRLVRRVAPSLTPVAVILIGLGTPIFFYSLTYWDINLVVFMALLAIWLLFDAHDFSSPRLWLAMLLLAGTVALRIEMAALWLAAGLSWGISTQTDRKVKKADVAHQTGASAVVVRSLFMVLVVTALVGLLFRSSLVTTRHGADVRHVLRDLTRLEVEHVTSMLREAPGVMVNSSAAEGYRLPQAWVWLGLGALPVLVLASTLRSRLWQYTLLLIAMATWILLPVLAFTSPQPYRSLHGILITAPYAVFIAFSVRGAWIFPEGSGATTSRRSVQLLLLTTLMYSGLGLATILLFRGMTPQNRFPGLEWGQRYLLPLYPLLVISMLIGLRWLLSWRSAMWEKWTILGLLSLMMLSSIYIQARGVLMLYQTRQGLSRLAHEAERSAAEPIVTDVWWLPASLADVFTHQEMYSVQDLRAMERWLAKANAAGVRRFTLMTASPALIQATGERGWHLRGSNLPAYAGVIIARFEFSSVE